MTFLYLFYDLFMNSLFAFYGVSDRMTSRVSVHGHEVVPDRRGCVRGCVLHPLSLGDPDGSAAVVEEPHGQAPALPLPSAA